ncbi:hypothetical protein C0995_012958 [Termitomyces sp. Mi166|nr:hypothetical protein C0995_012958 [Termitomyces sp. Mi166\
MSASEKKQIPASPSGPQPLIPDKYLDIPSQRLYYLSLGLLCQAIKIVDFSWYLVSADETSTNCRKWLFVDFAYCVILTRLRIPRLTYSRAVVLLQIVLLWFLDGLMFGGISFNLPFQSNNFGALSTPNSQVLSTATESSGFLGYVAPFTFGLFASGPKDVHLVGQHTVRMSPISTAHLNPDSLPFCLSPPNNFVLVPVLLNNTTPAELKFSLTPLGHDVPEILELTSKDLKTIEQDRLAALRALRPSTSVRDSNEYDEYDDDEDVDPEAQGTQPLLQSTQSLVHIRVTRPGTLRLESLLDQSRVPVRISYASTVNIVPCPTVEFIDKELAEDNVRCAGQDPDLELMIRVYGVPPLSLRWLKTINGRREHYLVEGIENNSASKEGLSTTRRGAPAEMKIPLSIALDPPGTYVYVLEEVTDSVGNVVRIGPDTSADFSGSIQTKTTRSLVVLRRPRVSFKSCGHGSPTSLLIGSEVSLGISINDADEFDSPWEISLKYEPSSDGNKRNKRHHPWNKTLRTQDHQGDLSVRASAPGEYAIIGVQGKVRSNISVFWGLLTSILLQRCSGDVLSPETCRVVEKPLPTAEIEWKQIHECSGDTGVSASLVLRGTPPFQVHYRMQRDNESPRDQSKTFSSSRGELTLQPERSGHYTFTFTHLSDAFYKKLELKGPSIDQVIHPLAAVDFVASHGGNRRRISSCDGDFVSVDVELRVKTIFGHRWFQADFLWVQGTGPWNLEAQVVGPRSSEIIKIEGIDAPRKSISIPIPKGISSDGETFDINIGK